MDQTRGLRLIEELKNDPEKFCKGGEKTYQLIEEYFKGFSKETLRELFYLENKRIRQEAIWITSELGRYSTDLLKEVVALINDDDVTICYFALKTVAHFANGEYIDDFMKVFSFLEHTDKETRKSVMLIISGLSKPRLHEAYVCLSNKKIYNISHEKGLLALLDVNALTVSEITQMIESGDALIR